METVDVAVLGALSEMSEPHALIEFSKKKECLEEDVSVSSGDEEMARVSICFAVADETRSLSLVENVDVAAICKTSRVDQNEVYLSKSMEDVGSEMKAHLPEMMNDEDDEITKGGCGRCVASTDVGRGRRHPLLR